jgi:aspartate 1-decarboxylase
MQRNMLQAKIHRVKATQTEVDYEGSVAIDRTLMEAADIREFQAIDVYNINNGERFSSYAVAGERGSGVIAVLGSAARRVSVNDLLIICTYSNYSEEEVENHNPHLVYVNDENQITHTHNGCNEKSDNEALECIAS